jgi:hypothetical protein
MRRVLVLALGTALLTAAGVSASLAANGRNAAPTPAPGLTPFASCERLLAYARKYGLQAFASGGFGVPGVPGGRPGPAQPAPAAGAADGGGGGVDYSATNVQEAGVDEPDIVKTDGARILAIAQGKLWYVDVSGPRPRLRGSLTLENGFASGLLVYGNRALVFTSGGVVQPLPVPQTGVAAPMTPLGTVLAEVDLSDPDALRLVRTLSVDGAYLSARLVGSTARVVLHANPVLPFVGPLGPGPAELRAAERRNRAVITSSTVRSWLPHYVLRNEVSGRTKRGSLVACRHVRYPKQFSGVGTLTVLTIDLAKGIEPIDSTTVMTDGEIVYASQQNLYVATPRWIDARVVSPLRVPPASVTALHEFDSSDPARTVYRASGQVPGYLLNQWSLSEYRGALRVASTTMPLWWPTTASQENESLVTVLEQRAGNLVQVGQVGGLGRGQRIVGVRFVDDTGYVVTFRRVDPLYTIDLSDPAHPAVVGTLEVLGYSAYLHPVGANRLLAVGQDATDAGATLGTQVSLFDTSDLQRPVQLDHMTIANGSSEAEFDHHAFLYWPKTQLAVLPVQTALWAARASTQEPFVGAIGVRVDAGGKLTLLGKVSHVASPQPQALLPTLAAIRRALVVGGTLYTLSEAGLKASNLATLADSAWVPFPQAAPRGGTTVLKPTRHP